jgi:hypothetical protein
MKMLFFTFFIACLSTSFTLHSQSIVGETYSGDGVYVTFTESGVTVKWTTTDNSVTTRKATYGGTTIYNYREGVLWKISGSTNYFILQPCIGFSDCFYLKYFNELGSMYWTVTCTKK